MHARAPVVTYILYTGRKEAEASHTHILGERERAARNTERKKKREREIETDTLTHMYARQGIIKEKYAKEKRQNKRKHKEEKKRSD